MSTVDHDLQRRWLDELRSGTRKQGKKRLRRRRDGQNFDCCQGVACDLVDPTGWSGGAYPKWQQVGDGALGLYSLGITWPWALVCRLGLPEGATDGLGRLNDSGKSFPEIADTAEQMMRDNGTHWEQAS